MAESPADTGRRPRRFPYTAALLCAACIGTAVWLPVRYWTVLEVTPKDPGADPGIYWRQWVPLIGRYVRLHMDPTWNGVIDFPQEDGTVLCCHGSGKRKDFDVRAFLLIPASQLSSRRLLSSATHTSLQTTHRTYSGRVRRSGAMVIVDTTEGRFHGAGFAGLAVGAMGVFVFAVALRHWLAERREFREEARA